VQSSGEAVRNQLSLGCILRAFLPFCYICSTWAPTSCGCSGTSANSTRRCWRCESAMWRRSFSTFASKHVRVAEIATTRRGSETGAARAAPSQPSSQPARRGDCRAYASARRLQAPANSNSASRIHISSVAIDCGVKPVAAIASVRTIITVAGSLRASSAALICPAISSPETSAAFGRRKELRKSRITWAILSRRQLMEA
jgi:hypothetical protein